MSGIVWFFRDNRLGVVILDDNFLVFIRSAAFGVVDEAFALEKLLAARFLQQNDVRNGNVFGNSLAHIVDGESGGGDCAQCFHFDTSFALAFNRRPYIDTIIGHVEFGVDDDRRNWNVVTQRNDFGRTFGRDDARYLSDGQYVTFFHRILFDQSSYFGTNVDSSAGHSDAFGYIFVIDIDHACFARGICVR